MFAVDGSEASKKALNYSIKSVFDAKTDRVIIMFVRPEFDDNLRWPETASSAELQRWERAIVSQAQTLLDEALAEVKAAHPGIQVEMMLGEGDPRDVLCNRATEEFVDFIIVGSQGKTALTPYFVVRLSLARLYFAVRPASAQPCFDVRPASAMPQFLTASSSSCSSLPCSGTSSLHRVAARHPAAVLLLFVGLSPVVPQRHFYPLSGCCPLPCSGTSHRRAAARLPVAALLLIVGCRLSPCTDTSHRRAAAHRPAAALLPIVGCCPSPCIGTSHRWAAAHSLATVLILIVGLSPIVPQLCISLASGPMQWQDQDAAT
ncbi:unnamed protein product [Closterium sp. NIES-54]